MNHYNPDSFPFPESIGHFLGKAAVLKDRVLDTQLAALEISAAQFRVLVYIGLERANTPADLCRELAVDSGSMTRMLDRLERKGLLLRAPCADDRRCVRLALSEAGQSIYQQSPQLGAAAMNELARGLDAQELQSLISLLRKLLLAHEVPAAAAEHC
ncbi:MarR family transcriptional regulator [Pseudomonas sp. UL073]|uniref:MarR family transcriptional regulator n=1 Tax=Zestomonas insulae TaxID=2809017 RepID=A0ABS2IIT4_9GAMM|nr:MarR family transcriptional regulator [Pseudomonas insulae]MBM7061758.1 MarR family transcriptional regulator [Pseudomonas insulae]